MSNDSDAKVLDDLMAPPVSPRARGKHNVRLTLREAAAAWGVSYTTVRKWVRQGRVKAEKVGRDWWILQTARPARLPRGGLTDAQRAGWNTGAGRKPGDG